MSDYITKLLIGSLVMMEYTDDFDLNDYDSTVNLSIETKLDIKPIEEE